MLFRVQFASICCIPSKVRSIFRKITYCYIETRNEQTARTQDIPEHNEGVHTIIDHLSSSSERPTRRGLLLWIRYRYTSSFAVAAFFNYTFFSGPVPCFPQDRSRLTRTRNSVCIKNIKSDRYLRRRSSLSRYHTKYGPTYIWLVCLKKLAPAEE